jgi:hypothetical protein
MDNNDPKIAKLTKINDAKYWAQILIDDGKLADIKFEIDKDNFNNFSEAVVVENDHEYVWPFIELSMMVLVAHTQRYINDIVEAFIFKELHDLAY